MDRHGTDLSLTAKGESFQLEARSVMGMLWLQTHFETSTWDLICSGTVRLKADCSHHLCRDAREAGLNVACLSLV